jgi:carbon monoxide dehydrogenase subunit G
VASAAVQVVNDASLYNYREKPKMSRVMALGRAIYPLWNAAVALGIFLWTDRAFLSVGQSIMLASLMLLIYPLMGLSDAAHLGSTHAYASSLQDTLDFVRAAYASDIHRLKSSIRARASFTTPETKAALQDVFLQTELIRHLAVQGRAVASIGDVLAAVAVVIRERSRSARVTYIADADVGGITIDPVGLQLLERIVLDTVDNAINASAPSAEVTIRGTELPHSRIALEVVVVDDGPGYDVPNELPFGSSLRQLQRQTERMGGDLSISSAATGTRVTSTFVTPRVLLADGMLGE